MIEYPPESGYYIVVVGPNQFRDLMHPPTSDELLLWDLEDEWDNMVNGNSPW